MPPAVTTIRLEPGLPGHALARLRGICGEDERALGAEDPTQVDSEAIERRGARRRRAEVGAADDRPIRGLKRQRGKTPARQPGGEKGVSGLPWAPGRRPARPPDEAAASAMDAG